VIPVADRAAGHRSSARLRLALSYAVFLVAAGGVVLFGVYVVLRYVPNYPLTAANPSDVDVPLPTREEILTTVVRSSSVILVLLAIIGFSGGWVLAGWVLRPLRRINEATRRAAQGELDYRIHLTGRNDEFRQLADAFDHMLDRVSESYSTQERFAANASHELRTPLAITETLLDVARSHPGGQDYPALLDRLSDTNARAIALTDALLRLADANEVSAVVAPVDLGELMDVVIGENRAALEDRGLELHASLERAIVPGDPTLLWQLATNLLQNAIRHGRAGGFVRVVTGSAAAGRGEMLVENDGDVYTEDQAAQLVEPFLRGTGRIAAPKQQRGHGLGLALVAQIVAVHGGELVVRARAGGGLRVSVAIPAAPSA